MLRRVGSRWVVYSRKGKRLSKPMSRTAAVRRLHWIESLKRRRRRRR